jgi:hypothetical protein
MNAKTTSTPEAACAGRETSELKDSLDLLAHNELAKMAWNVCMDGAVAFQNETEHNPAMCPHPKSSLAGQLWAAGYFMDEAEKLGASSARSSNTHNPYLGSGVVCGVTVGPFSGLLLQRAYLAKFWQDGYDQQIAENQALQANAQQARP